MCTSTEPVGTGIGAVCVNRGRPKRPLTMLNHTHALTENKKSHPTRSQDPLWRGFLFLGKPREKGSRFAFRAPLYDSVMGYRVRRLRPMHEHRYLLRRRVRIYCCLGLRIYLVLCTSTYTFMRCTILHTAVESSTSRSNEVLSSPASIPAGIDGWSNSLRTL